MGSSQADKAASHERIVDAAGTQIRRGGVASLNVANLMNDAGLTHGGFYRHFASRDALIAEAVEVALERGKYQTSKRAPLRPSATRSLHEVIDTYLSQEHRDDPGTGCAIAGLASDVARGGEDVRATYTTHVSGYLDQLRVALQGRAGGAEDAPHLTLAALVGALVLARAVSDPRLSDELLSHTARALHELAARQ